MEQLESDKIHNGILFSNGEYWYFAEGNKLWVGILHNISREFGELIHIELPEVGEDMSYGCVFGLLCSLKRSVELTMPISGHIAAINEELEEKPELIQNDLFNKSWLITIETEDQSVIERLKNTIKERGLN